VGPSLDQAAERPGGVDGAPQPASPPNGTSRSGLVRCREIGLADVAGVIDLLTRGFSAERSRSFWVRALARLADRTVPTGCPQFGILLESGGIPVGVLLLIFADVRTNGRPTIRCNVSSWYVEPEYRAFGSILVSQALKRFPATYLNVTPAPHTLPLLRAQGYTRHSEGVFVSIPVLGVKANGSVAAVVDGLVPCEDDLLSFEPALLAAHARWGCLSLVCKLPDGALPFVFALRHKFGVLPTAVLIYCRNIDGLVKASGVLGRFLARRGIFLVTVDANGPVPGLTGKYLDSRPKFFKGPNQPAIGDLAYTEVALFGV